LLKGPGCTLFKPGELLNLAGRKYFDEDMMIAMKKQESDSYHAILLLQARFWQALRFRRIASHNISRKS
jgi:hypothetical protein